jgi:hypothetical protein
MEERAGERRRVFVGCPSPRSSPHSFLAERGGELDAAVRANRKMLSKLAADVSF